MKVTVRIPDELADRARAKGVKVETYIEDLLTAQATAEGGVNPAARSPEEIRRWLDSLAQFSDKIPPLPDIISRERIYQEHD